MTPEDVTTADARRIVAICGAKGGCGASMMATNLAVFLAQIGKNVVLVDANVQTAGLHAWLGIPRPKRGLTDFVKKRVATIEEALSPTPITGLSLLAGNIDLITGYRPTADEREDLVAELRNVEADFVIVDLPSGLHPLTVDVFGDVEVSIAVATPTPDAVEATYRLFMATYLSRLRSSPNLDELTETVLENLCLRPGHLPTPREIVNVLKDAGLPIAEHARSLASTFHPQIVVNMIRMKADHGVGDSMVAATARWIGILSRLLGTVEWDENVWLSLRRGNPLLVDFPQSRACRGLERVVRRILAQDFKAFFEVAAVPKSTTEQNLYEILEIYPSASEEEVRRGYKQVRDYFGVDGLAVSGVCSEEEREDYQRRAKEAHEILVDRTKRKEYDRLAFPDGFPKEAKRFEDGRKAVAGPVVSPHDSLPEVTLREDQMVTGALLGEIRKERGIELVDISNRAKVSMSYLRAIENEQFDELPASVYIRGFVTEYAKYLKIDPKRAVSDFMATWDAHKAKQRKAGHSR